MRSQLFRREGIRELDFTLRLVNISQSGRYRVHQLESLVIDSAAGFYRAAEDFDGGRFAEPLACGCARGKGEV